MLVFLYLITLSLLLVLSAWIPVAEKGITSLSKYRVKKLIAQTSKLSESLLSWLAQSHYLLTIILTANVIVDMLTSFLSTFVMTSVFCVINRNIVKLLTWIVTSFTVLIFGEIIPKFYARTNSERITVVSVPVLAKVGKILGPFYIRLLKLLNFCHLRI